MSAPSDAITKQGWSKDLADCHPAIRAAYPIAQAKFLAAHPDLWMRPDYSWRSTAFQHTLFEKGRTLQNGVWVLTDPAQKVTDDDGIVKKSHHNVYESQALDFIIFRGKTPLWVTKSQPENEVLYVEVARMLEAQGLVAGATWSFIWKDWYHTQVAYKIV